MIVGLPQYRHDYQACKIQLAVEIQNSKFAFKRLTDFIYCRLEVSMWLKYIAGGTDYLGELLKMNNPLFQLSFSLPLGH